MNMPQVYMCSLPWTLLPPPSPTFKISFLLLTLVFLLSSFSSCFRCRVRLFFWIFLISWGKPLLLWTFPLALLIVSHRLSVIVFSFSLLLHAYFDFFFDFFCDLLVIQKRVVQPPYVGILIVFLLYLQLILLHCCQKRCLEWFQYFFEFTKARFMAQDVIYSREGSVWAWEKDEIYCLGVKCPIDIS